jgi:hypothetical protein
MGGGGLPVNVETLNESEKGLTYAAQVTSVKGWLDDIIDLRGKRPTGNVAKRQPCKSDQWAMDMVRKNTPLTELLVEAKLLKIQNQQGFSIEAWLRLKFGLSRSTGRGNGDCINKNDATIEVKSSLTDAQGYWNFRDLRMSDNVDWSSLR